MKAITTLAALLVLSGCASIVTVNPLYSDEEDLAQDLALEGAWQEGSDIWTISRNGDGYTLIDDDGEGLRCTWSGSARGITSKLSRWKSRHLRCRFT